MTVDTALRHIPSAPASADNWMEQIASLKLELANAKADHDRLQWKCQRLQQHRDASDAALQSLRDENKSLRVRLKEQEKQQYLQSVRYTQSCHPQQANNQNNNKMNRIKRVQQQHSTTTTTTTTTTTLQLSGGNSLSGDNEEDDDSIGEGNDWFDSHHDDNHSLNSTQRTSHRTTIQPGKNQRDMVFGASFNEMELVDIDVAATNTDMDKPTSSTDTATTLTEPNTLVSGIQQQQTTKKDGGLPNKGTALWKDGKKTKVQYPVGDPFSTFNDDSDEDLQNEKNRGPKWWPHWK